MLAVDWQNLGTGAIGQRAEQRAPHDEHFLARERHRISRAQSRLGGPEAHVADGGDHHDIGIRTGRQLRQPIGIQQPPPTRRPLAVHAVGIAHAGLRHIELRELPEEEIAIRGAGQSDDLEEVTVGPDDIQGLSADRAGGPENDDALGLARHEVPRRA